MRRQFIQASLVAAALAWMQGSCGGKFGQSAEGVTVAGSAGTPGQEPADVVLRKVAFVRSLDGRVVARGTAARAAYRQAGGKVEASQLLVDLPPGSHAPADLGQLRVSAPSASGDLPGKSGAGWGGVLVLAERGDEARTDRVLIDGERDEVRAPGEVELRGSGFTLHSASLVARSDGSRVQFQGGVSGQLQSSVNAAPAQAKPAPRRRKR